MVPIDPRCDIVSWLLAFSTCTPLSVKKVVNRLFLEKKKQDVVTTTSKTKRNREMSLRKERGKIANSYFTPIKMCLMENPQRQTK